MSEYIVFVIKLFFGLLISGILIELWLATVRAVKESLDWGEKMLGGTLFFLYVAILLSIIGMFIQYLILFVL